ncbi:MAG: 16S rRNA (cytosine(1402)-N(4))-methyltransferase RsmH [Ichthyobacteriaceae bacterium]|nr:16S rRNA (cytosine(1402)-N(4))-methyltransferase RsmH [Ichthyobacteriaceae bacterium]
MEYHVPVMLNECLDGLNIKEDGIYVDVTFGGGGHSRGIMSRLGENGKLFAFDQDKDAINNAIDDPRFTLINVNFKHIINYLRLHKITKVDGILADLGVSSHQFDVAERGFSTRFDGKLDMRMNQGAELSAYQIVNEYDVEDLSRIFRDYGELKNAWKVANRIVDVREDKPIETNEELKEILEDLATKRRENRFYAQLFQAIRIEVNNEMGVLKSFLESTVKLLKPEGRLVVMSYHSLEDRLVKRYVKNGMFKGEPEKDVFGNIDVPFKTVNRKVIVPTEDEIVENSRSRSAKLRIAEKL